MKKFKIIKKNFYTIELEATDDGKLLQVGFKKRAILFQSLRSKNVGDLVELQVDTSNKGNLYALDSDEFALAMQKVDLFNHRNALMRKEAEGF